ncbi:MAG: acyl-phosphate glycerol 3-phosphate acyltransferase [Betaproteobacteria bacterium HGW-Betaproteobacteria-12]|nr:MAG: acyl-phosphate glycerol 3-phosphate acyltransferase [Betaproteobacteria bacterium HGW-Betaproteobacteria-12]
MNVVAMRKERGGIDPAQLLAVVGAVVREARPNVAPPQVTLDSALEKDLGLDSLARVELVLRLEREFAASLPEQALATSETPRDLLRFLLGSAGQAPQAAAHSLVSLVRSDGVRAPNESQARTLTEALAYHVERQPDRLTVFMYEEQQEFPLSYRALWDGALGYAAQLVQAGLQPGQMVAIMLPTGREYLYAFYGVQLAGGVPVPLYPPARLSTIEDHMTRHVGILNNAGAVIMITVPEAKALAYLLRARVESLRTVLVPADLAGSGAGFSPVPGRPGDMGFLQYTSGSTGSPKGVVLSHANLMANVRAMGAAVKASPEDVFVSWLPLYHDLGLIGANFAALVLGFPTVLMSPLAFLARPASWLRAIHRHRGTISGGPNFAFELCLRRIPDAEMQGIDLSSWRFAFNAAEPVSPDTIVQFEQRFAQYGLRRNCLAPSYGLAESSVGVAITPPGTAWRADRLDRERFTRSGQAVFAGPGDLSPLVVIGCGTPIPGHDIRVVDTAGFELPDRQEGLLQFRGPSSTSGYYRNPAATKTLFAGDWLNTGDRAYLAEGVLFITGREKDIIIRGGRNISPYELEHAVGDLAGVRRGCVAVFGSTDAASGTERVVVLAEMREGDASRHADLRWMINELAIGLIGGPADDIVLAPPGTVPKTSSGKIRRVAARQYYERGPAAVQPPAVWRQFARLMLAGAAPQLRRGARTLGGLLFALRAYAVFGALFPLALVVAPLASVPACWRVGGFVARWFLRLSGIPVVAHGLEHLDTGAPVVVAVNHTSYLDAVVLLSQLRYRGYAFVAKREFQDNPLMRRLLAGYGTRFIERFDVAKSAEQANELAVAARQGVSLIVFPEGTLTRHTGLRAFRTGAFQAAASAGIAVVPIALRGVRSVLRDETWYLRRAPVAMTVGAPIRPAGTDWAAAVALREAVRAEILRGCGEPDLAAAGGALDEVQVGQSRS